MHKLDFSETEELRLSINIKSTNYVYDWNYERRYSTTSWKSAVEAGLVVPVLPDSSDDIDIDISIARVNFVKVPQAH